MTTIYLISRDPDFAFLCGMALPFTTVTPQIGEDLIAGVIRTSPSAILVDLLGPQDWQTIAQLKAAPHTQKVPVIVFTGWLSPDRRFRRLARELGCSAFVAKPCDTELLAKTIARAIGGEAGLEVVQSFTLR